MQDLSLNELAIITAVGIIFDRYDTSNTGKLNRMEAFTFMQDTLGNESTGENITDDLFNQLFNSINLDGTGQINKREMLLFIKNKLHAFEKLEKAYPDSKQEERKFI